MDNTFWGPEYSDKQVAAAFKQHHLPYKLVQNIEQKTAELISRGFIVSWIQGKMEWGPRALGNRSLLADPRNPDMKELLNSRIKRREPFRPFAPSVLAEDIHEWFNIPKSCKSVSTEFMEFSFPTKKAKRQFIHAVIHVDGSSRIQVVKEKLNSKYHKLISEFKKITGVPMILNTSFNDNEPIVCKPQDAIKTFKRTKMDYLVINNFLASKVNKQYAKIQS